MDTDKSFKLTVQYATACKDVPTRPQFRRWVKATLMQPAEIVLRLVDAVEGQELNRNFRGKDYATNVLTFVYNEMQPLAGDIVLCDPIVKREASEQRKNPMAHYAHLTIHGVLHLQGYDHIEAADAAEMERLETQIMTKLGYGDPYAECA